MFGQLGWNRGKAIWNWFNPNRQKGIHLVSKMNMNWAAGDVLMLLDDPENVNMTHVNIICRCNNSMAHIFIDDTIGQPSS
jgi:hypothetical protein